MLSKKGFLGALGVDGLCLRAPRWLNLSVTFLIIADVNFDAIALLHFRIVQRLLTAACQFNAHLLRQSSQILPNGIRQGNAILGALPIRPRLWLAGQ